MENFDFIFTPITEETLERQKWIKIHDKEPNGDKFYYWILPLPKDNPDDNCPVLVTTANDEWEDYGIKKGEYIVEIDGFFGLGGCTNEEELEILYRALTRKELE